jgi:IS6 family transposase
LSYWDVAKLLAERGVTVDQVTVYRWVQRLTPEFSEAALLARHAPGDRWFADETYVKVAGRWTYLYRAIDQHGQVIDVLLSARRDPAAARRFFTRALRAGTIPAEVTTDRAPVYPRVLDELIPSALHTVERYANHPVETDHGRPKARLRPMRGLKRHRSARTLAAGHAFVQNIRRGHYELATEAPARHRLRAAFDQLFSEQIVHPPIIDDETFRQGKELLTARAGVRGSHKPHKSSHDYALKGLLFCGVCGRRMQGHWANAAPYYRCRFPSEYALANRVAHPLNVTLRRDVLLGPLDGWLSSKFGRRHLGRTIDELSTATIQHQADPGNAEIDARIADCDRKLAQYRATLDAGADPATVARWITETEAERARHKRAATPRPAATSMSRDEMASIVSALADILAVLRDADPADKAEIYTQLGLRLTYQPSERLVRTEVQISPAQHWQFESVRGGT